MKKLLVTILLPVLLSGCSGKISQRILPDQSYAVYLPAQAQPLKSVRLEMLETPQEGSLLLSVVACTRNALGQPVPSDSVLVAPLTLTQAQLHARGTGPLEIPLGSSDFRVPPQGVFLVAQCRPTLATDSLVAFTVANRESSDPTTRVILHTAANQDKVLPATSFPALAAAQLPATPTYVRLHPTAHWLAKPQFFSLCVGTTPNAK